METKDIIKLFNNYRSYKQPILKEWRLIRSMYRGDFWDTFKKHLADYTMTPDWNYFDYTIQAYLNSIYSGAFIGTLTPCAVEDADYVQGLNAFIAYNWNKWGMKNKFLHIGENGELYNLGAVRVDWDDEKKTIKLKELSPDEIYFDPSVSDFHEGHAVFIERAVNIDILKTDPRFEDGVKKYLKEHRVQDRTLVSSIAQERYHGDTTVSLIEGFIRNDKGTIDQVFILDESTEIYRQELDLELFPIECFFPQRPDGNPYGRSKLMKILNNTITLNLIDSMEATQPYRLLNRVRFINVDGRINLRSFHKYGNTPGASFEVKGNPAELVKYADVPTIPDMSILKARLENAIFQVTGVDPYYKGRMTNSIQTTGATQAFQARVTMLTDNARITLLEEFCENLTRLIIRFHDLYSNGTVYSVPKRSAVGNNNIIGTTELTFEHKPYDYMINASILLPMNQANLFESAKALYEMQGQYQFKTQVITEQDLIRYSDFPQKDLILQRLQSEAENNTAENLVADLTNFASIFTKLMSQGLDENQAAEQAIQILIEEKNAMMQDPSLGQGFQ